MYCERCGNQPAEGSRFCANCGKPLGLSVVPLDRQGKVERHLQTLAILWFLCGALELLGGFFLFLAGSFFTRVVPSLRGDVPVLPFMRGMFTVIGVIVLLKALVSFASGWGLLQRESWARPMALVAAFVALLSLPFGTALGIYTLWVLLPFESGREYEQLARAA